MVEDANGNLGALSKEESANDGYYSAKAVASWRPWECAPSLRRRTAPRPHRSDDWETGSNAGVQHR